MPAPTPASDQMAATAATTSSPRILTLIVATAPHRGIGRAGGLPWPPLKGEMAHFRRCTRELRAGAAAAGAVHNAVLMGRNTWTSIPARFRPLAGRANVVVTRDPAAIVGDGSNAAGGGEDGPRTATSLEGALEAVWSGPDAARIGETFVVGGAGMYAAALGHAACRRVLLTRVRGEFECDVFFPLDMEGAEARAAGWRRGDARAAGWVEGDTVRSESGVEYEFCLYER